MTNNRSAAAKKREAQKKIDRIAIAVKESVRFELEAVLDYLWHDESRHYSEGDQPEGHIFESLVDVANWLDGTPNKAPADHLEE